MKHFFLFILSLTTFTRVVRAQYNNQVLPACAIVCTGFYLPQSTCSVTDQHCICTNEALMTNVSACVMETCSKKEVLTTLNVTSHICDWPVHDKQSLVRAMSIPFLVVGTLCYLTRIAGRLPYFGSEFGADDYMISAAWFCALCFSVGIILVDSAGLGKDIWNIPFNKPNDQLTYTLQLLVAAEKVYMLSVWFTKMSILLFYLRIFPAAEFRTKARLCLAFCAATVFCLFFACLFKCWPISYSWTLWDGEHQGTCVSENAQGWANAGLSILGDLLVLSLPLPTIWKMTMSKEKRIRVMIMFGMGILLTLVSIVRLYTLTSFSLSGNITWDLVNCVYWSVIEAHVGIICACLPGLQNFYSRIVLGKILGKGQFVPGTRKPDSPATMRRHLAQKSQGLTNRSNSTASEISNITTLARNFTNLHKEIILVVNDVQVEARSISPDSHNNDWRRNTYGVESRRTSTKS